MRGYATIWRNRKSGNYIVQPAAKGPVSTAEFGEPTHVPGDQFDRDIVAVIIENLHKYQTQVFDRTLARRFTPDEYRRFIRAHLSVSARWEDTGELVIRPLHPERGGLIARDGEEIILAEKEIPLKLPSAIRDALSRAG